MPTPKPAKTLEVTRPKGGPASADVEVAKKKLEKLIAEIQKIFIGQESVVHAVAVGLLAQGNILLEGAPGLGKTLLVRVLSECIDLKYSRIQFTPDLMPADITGTQALVSAEGGNTQLVFKPGPIFANIVLADEINRATPKTQSALLEAMQEHAVTVSGERMILKEPFFVLATQNPLEMEGTYPLPEAQMDRFLLKVDVCFPSFDVLRDIGTLTTAGELEPVGVVMTGKELVDLQKLLRRIVCAPHVSDYAAKITLATHPTSDTAPDLVERYVQYGASPRAMQALLLCGRAEAMLDGRPWVSTEDIQKVTHAVLRHRMILRFEAELEEIAPDEIVDAVLKATPISHAD